MNFRRFCLTATVLVLAPAALHAEEASPPADAVPEYQLKNRSTFAAPVGTARAPFWPIGWVKRKGVTSGSVETPLQPKFVLDEKSFKVTSILLGSGTTPSLAVINGRAYSEGEFVRMPKGATPPIRIRVQRISDGTVVLQHADQTLVAALQRPELNTRRTEELLLDADR